MSYSGESILQDHYNIWRRKMTNEMLLLNKLDEDINWFKEHQTELEEEYDNQL